MSPLDAATKEKADRVYELVNRLNKALDEAVDVDLSVELDTEESRMFGSRAKHTKVTCNIYHPIHPKNGKEADVGGHI